MPNLLKDAASEFKNNNFQKAIDIYTRILSFAPRHYYAHLWSGTAYSAINKTSEAISCYQHAIDINAKGFDAYLNYSKLEMKQNRYENSLSLIKKAIKFHPFNAEGHSNMYYQKGLLEYYLYNYHDALDSFNKSLELFPENDDALNGRFIVAESILTTNNIQN